MLMPTPTPTPLMALGPTASAMYNVSLSLSLPLPFDSWTWNKSLVLAIGRKSASRNSSLRTPAHDDSHKVAQIVFMLVLFVFMVLANGSVILVTSVTRKSSRVKFFIMNLAIADLLVTLLSHLPDTIMKICSYWYAAEFICRAMKYIMGVVSYASRYVLVAMTIDRLHAIVKPMSFAEGGRLSKILIGLAWLLALLFAVPFLVFSRVQMQRGQPNCVVSFKLIQPLFYVTPNNTQLFNQQAWRLYTTSIACLVFFIPTLIIACCYAVIISVVWRSQTKLRELAPGCARATASSTEHIVETNSRLGLLRPISFRAARRTTKSSVEPATYSCRRSDSNGSVVARNMKKGVLPKAKIKSIYMTFVIVIAFVLCWTPFFLFNLLDVYRAIPQTNEKQAISVLIQSLSHLHSAVNPIIFYMFNRDAWAAFRQIAFINTLRCCLGERKGGRSGSDNSTSTRTSYYYRSSYMGGTIRVTHSQTPRKPCTSSRSRSCSAERETQLASLAKEHLSSLNSVLAVNITSIEIIRPTSESSLNALIQNDSNNSNSQKFRHGDGDIVIENNAEQHRKPDSESECEPAYSYPYVKRAAAAEQQRIGCVS